MKPTLKAPGRRHLNLEYDVNCFQFCFNFAFKFKLRLYKEGPHSISPRFANPTPLQAGMIVSDEPGYYEDGNFGRGRAWGSGPGV
jgi:hypothetical protein